MTIQYKNQGFKQADVNKATVLTCPTTAAIIIKSVYCANNNATTSFVVNMNLVDSSDSSTEYEFFRDDVPQGLNLEAGDAITVQAATGSNTIQGAISYALINRENENG
mgnify:CR=1 FL=1